MGCGESLAQWADFHNGWRRAPDARPFLSNGLRGTGGRSDFFDLNDGLALIGPAIQASVMRKLEFMTLWTDRHPRWGDPQFLRPSLVASRS